MGLIEYTIGELVELVEETNSQGKYGPNDVRGMTITKEVIPTKADVSNTDLSKFIVVHPKEFVFNPRTHGKKIGFGYNNTNTSFIISWNNIAFRVKEESENIVLPEYLFLHFNRDEWDREACFRSWGSSTEVFSWDALCEMKLTLPHIDQQRKFVDIYLALQNNLATYQSKVDELKLVCEGFLDKLRNENNCIKIGKYIEQCDERNSDNIYTLDDLRGISIEKKFIYSKADMKDVSLTPYLLVKSDYFAFVPVTSRNGDKITLAYNDSDQTYIVSSAYVVFRVKEKDALDPSYLFMFFNRPEFDRYARFNSWGSAREVFSWEDMKEVAIPIPDIAIQRDIVKIHRSYIERQRIASQLKEQLNKLCPILIQGSLQN